MPNDMGTFRVDIELENPAKPGVKRALNSVLVDTGAELSWVPVEVLESLGVERNNQWRFRPAKGPGRQGPDGTAVATRAAKGTGGDVGLRRAGDPTPPGARAPGSRSIPGST